MIEKIIFFFFRMGQAKHSAVCWVLLVIWMANAIWSSQFHSTPFNNDSINWGLLILANVIFWGEVIKDIRMKGYSNNG